MKLKMYFVFITVIAMTGCVSSRTLTQMRDGKSIETFQSLKEPIKLAECILAEWQNHKFAGSIWAVYMQPLNGGYSVYTNLNWELADVMPNSNGSSVNFYAQSGIIGWRVEKRRMAVDACAKG